MKTLPTLDTVQAFVAVADGVARVIVRGETITDLLARDAGFEMKETTR